MKHILIFGSTGSIGKNTLNVVRKYKSSFKIKGLCTFSDIKTLKIQIKEFSPAYVCVIDEQAALTLKKLLSPTKKIRFFSGQTGLKEFSTLTCDVSVMAISGVACLKPLMINLEHAKRIALASKEPIVVAGSFVFEAAKKHNCEIIPVDSEINALFQLFEHLKCNGSKQALRKICLTASGGALFDYSSKQLEKVRVKDVLAHPTWSMGKRITVDSATLVNKGFEVVEAHYFFKLPFKDIEVVIHRESLVHALLEFKDSSIFSCIYPADMQIPLDYALNYPKRAYRLKGVDFSKKFALSFQPLENGKFPMLELIIEAGRKGGNSLSVMNACDETAVNSFINKKINYKKIVKVMEYIWNHFPHKKINSIGEVFYWDNWARAKTREYLKR